MEWVNQELEQYLQLFINERQDDWDKLIPLAEFQYNNHMHSITQQTPFMLDTGQYLQMGFEPHQVESQLETVNEFWDQMDSTLSEARSVLVKAKEDMAWYYNQHRVPAPEYRIRDKVYLDASDIHTTGPLQKLTHCYLRPFTVTQWVGQNAYHLQLLASMFWLHPVFNIVKLLWTLEDPIPGQKAHVRGQQPVFHSENISEFFKLWPQTPSAFLRLQLPPSSRDTSEYFLFRAPSSSPQHYPTLLPLWPLTQHPLWRLLWDLHLLWR